MILRVIKKVLRDLKSPHTVLGFMAWILLVLYLSDLLDVDENRVLIAIVIWNILQLERTLGSLAKAVNEYLKEVHGFKPDEC